MSNQGQLDAAVSRVALPASMRYALTQTDAVPASLSLRRFDAPAGTYAPTGANEIRISVQADGFLDTNKSYLYCTVTNTSTGETTTGTDDILTLQGDIGCMIDSLRIESQGVELERLEQYSHWNAVEMCWNSSLSDMQVRSAQSGGGEVNTTATTGLGGIDPVGQTFLVNDARNMVLPLKHSGFLFNHHGKALPQGAAQFEIRIRLQDTVTAFRSGDAGGGTHAYTVKNARLYCPVYRVLDESVMNQYRSLVAQRGISFTSDSFKTYINNVVDAAQTQIVQINDRSSSLLALISTMRTSADIGDVTFLGLQNNTLVGIDRYAYRIGGILYPESSIDVNVTDATLDIGRVYNEQWKAFAKYGWSHSEAQISKTRYIKTGNAVAATAAVSGAAVCVDLRTFSDNRLSFVGLNTAKNSVPNTLELTTSVAMDAASQITTFAKCEAEYFMSPDGRLTAAY